MTTPLQLLKPLVLSHLAVSLIFSLVLALYLSPQLGASYGVGAAATLINLLGISWVWWRTLAQKRIAWTVLIIVIKYAVLLGAIFILAQKPWFKAEGMGLGVASLAISALVMAIVTREKEKN